MAVARPNEETPTMGGVRKAYRSARGSIRRSGRKVRRAPLRSVAQSARQAPSAGPDQSMSAPKRSGRRRKGAPPMTGISNSHRPSGLERRQVSCWRKPDKRKTQRHGIHRYGIRLTSRDSGLRKTLRDASESRQPQGCSAARHPAKRSG